MRPFTSQFSYVLRQVKNIVSWKGRPPGRRTGSWLSRAFGINAKSVISLGPNHGGIESRKMAYEQVLKGE
jgi:hypothetical protein